LIFIAYLAERTKLRFVTFVTRSLKLRVFAQFAGI
jgi:hypothetical protein